MLDGTCRILGRDEKCIQILIGKLGKKRPLRGPRHREEDNIRMDVREIGREAVDWLFLAQDRDHWQALVNMVMNFWVL
jgi:hypothetical protein